ncbi:XRE family transcriptional regulator [Bradyrhizobium liaoningense]|uniref:XRE family transcriptional regulator n=1 Tax=Bradyrhizobium liaoningense TaxID=43992 RepID=UPI001BABCA2D|nr:XRE family transcriptional regulator [Bradyrhizobium liaoningense]MBR0707952.1 XRE family transcriptional regulator [Bradyrhizobium liaoningense]
MSVEPSNEDLAVHRSSGDFLADQGIADPDEFRVKSHLCHEIATIAEPRGLAAAALADLAGEPVDDVERMLRSRHDAYEVWRLIKVLTALGADVGITVFPDSGHDRGVVLSETVRKTKEQILRELAEMDEIDYQPEPRL